MSANFYCWAPSLGLDPKQRDFHDRIEALHEGPELPASPKLLAFVADLLARYPDLDGDDQDTAWAAGPLANEIIGDFINMAIVWSLYDEAAGFVIETAHRHGLHAYDPQGHDFFPCHSPGTAGGNLHGAKSQQRPSPATPAPRPTQGRSLSWRRIILAAILLLIGYGLWAERDTIATAWMLIDHDQFWSVPPPRQSGQQPGQ